jgi:hypothetical protein
VVVSGLVPNSSNTFTFVSRLDGLNSATTTLNVQTLGPLSNPVVSVEQNSTTETSITPLITSNNNRLVRAFGRFDPFNLNDLGLVSPSRSVSAAAFSDQFIEANRGVVFYSQFVDPVTEPPLQTNIIQTTLFTAPKKPQLSAFNFVVAGPDVVRIDFNIINNNNQFGPPLAATIEIFSQLFGDNPVAGGQIPPLIIFQNFGDLPVTGSIGRVYFIRSTNKYYQWVSNQYVEITEQQANQLVILPSSTSSYQFDIEPGDIPTGTSTTVRVVFSNPTTDSAIEDINLQT